MKRKSDVEAVRDVMVEVIPPYEPCNEDREKLAQRVLRLLKRRGWRKGKVLARGFLNLRTKDFIMSETRIHSGQVPVDVVERVK